MDGENLIDYLTRSLPFILKDYHFLSRIGVGSCGTVFEVWSEPCQCSFAVKVAHLDDSLISEDGSVFDPELIALCRLEHPAIVRLHDYFMYNDFLFLVIEFCHKGTLQDVMDHKQRPFPPSVIQRILHEITHGVFYCHQQQIAHRDIKPANIFVSKGFRTKLGDFDRCSISQDTVDTVCGSPAYVAPELFRGHGIDPYKADVFSLGATFYHIATRHAPYGEDDLVKTQLPPFPADFIPELKQLIIAMLYLDPRARPTIKDVLRHQYFQIAHGPEEEATPRKSLFGLAKWVSDDFDDESPPPARETAQGIPRVARSVLKFDDIQLAPDIPKHILARSRSI
jgi:serine/threonine protein kinase